MFRFRLGSVVGLLLLSVPALSYAQADGQTRTYYIAADEVDWDYVPGGRDQITGEVFVDTAFYEDADAMPVSTVYKKALYREYTDDSFTTLKPRPPEWEHLGFLGPMIRGVVGDTIVVVFKNNASRPSSVHPHGVFYDKDAEGAPYVDGTEGADKADDAVPPGETHTYVWPVPDRAGPGPMQGSSVMWMYHSHTHEDRDINTGLLGVMLVTARGQARPDGSPIDVDREFVTVFAQVHEEDSWYVGENLGALLAKGRPAPSFGPTLQSEIGNFYPWFVFFTINGYIRGALPAETMTMQVGEHVRWYVMGSTNDFDFHTPHWHGNVVTTAGMRNDVVSVLPMSMLTADMVPDNPGTWLYHCHVSFHNSAGMAARFVVVE